jgi:hypothetical protein
MGSNLSRSGRGFYNAWQEFSTIFTGAERLDFLGKGDYNRWADVRARDIPKAGLGHTHGIRA